MGVMKTSVTRKKGGERSSYQSRVKRKDKILPIFQSILDLDYILAVTQR